ncbi:vWA domain-containing protein [uncultured Clostridium sp.]|uniref:vWA domain-containing protein n=1 Tax=uncultured Clostridium sp. TaxID=59620 RepID=UPI002601C31B|nr:vWA domain-containing protein [uncultured Clostridium sp.]
MKVGRTNIEFLGQKNLMFESNNKNCKFYSLKLNAESTNCINHHILLIDVSKSMGDVIDKLKKSMKETLKVLKKEENNYVSIILYSGEKDVTLIARAIKCDDNSYRLTRIYKNIDEEVYSRENTVLSSALKRTEEIIEDMDIEGVKQHIILFTDGYIAELDNQKAERKSCFDIVKRLRKRQVSLSAIGLGFYYDRSFLKEVSSYSYNGSFNHISDIKDYYKVAISEVQRVNNSEEVNIEISNDEFFIVNEKRMFYDNKKIETLSLNKENIIVVLNDDLVINDLKVKSTKKAIKKEYLDDLSYALARYYVAVDDMHNMENAIELSGDQFVYDSLVNCNSFIEKGRAIELLESLVNDRDKRFKLGEKNTKIIKDKEPICLLELLNEIMSDDECKLLWDYSYKYRRIGVKEKEVKDKYEFQRPEVGFGEVTDITIGDKKLNIGMRVKIKGEVQNQVNKLKLDACIYRDYKLVVNGNINTDEVCCILSKNAKSILRKEKLIKGIIKVYNQEVCIINLKNMKLTNKKISNLIDEKTIARYLYDIEKLKCETWVLDKFVKEIFKEKDEKFDLRYVTEEEVEARRLFRVDSKGVYNPLKIEKDLDRPYEFYISKVVDWKIEKFPRAKERSIALEKYRMLIVGEVNESYRRVKSKLKELNKEKRYKQSIVNMIKISNRLNGKSVFIWDTINEKKKIETDIEIKKNMVVGGTVKISLKELDGIKIREDFYEVINKYN